MYMVLYIVCSGSFRLQYFDTRNVRQKICVCVYMRVLTGMYQEERCETEGRDIRRVVGTATEPVNDDSADYRSLAHAQG